MRNMISKCLLVSILVAAGCQKPGGGSSGVAVIDLDKVATAMGWMDEMTKSLQSADADLKGQLDVVLRNTLGAIEEAKKQVAADAKLTPEQTKTLITAKDQRELEGLPLSKEQRDKLVETAGKANVAWQSTLNEYRQALQGRRANLVMTYREKIRPSARRVAATRGLTIVLITSDNMLYFDPQSADITDKVVDDLQKHPPENKPVTATVPATIPVPPQPSSTTPK